MTLRSLGDLWEGYLVTFGLKGDREVRWEQIEACMGYREIEIVSTDKSFDNYGHEVEKKNMWWLEGV